MQAGPELIGSPKRNAAASTIALTHSLNGGRYAL